MEGSVINLAFLNANPKAPRVEKIRVAVLQGAVPANAGWFEVAALDSPARLSGGFPDRRRQK
jgi:2-keto-3-deoxy-galactonokinase